MPDTRSNPSGQMPLTYNMNAMDRKTHLKKIDPRTAPAPAPRGK